MATRTITVNLQANASGMVAGFRQAQQAAQGFASQTAQFAERNRESMEGVGKAGMVAGGVLVAGFGKAVSTFASFDKAMSGVQAATHESTANMDRLRDAAVEAGADTAFSAEEAAGAVEELAKAGVATADILSGGLNGALSLAAAGELDVAKAAELAASSMTQFGLSGSEIPHIADLLAAGAGKAQGSVEDMGMALNQAGLVANQVGLSIEETTGGLAAFASAGLTGSDAGTSFKSMLQRLTPQSAEASRLMEELGLSAYNSQGEFIGLSEYAGELQDALKGMTDEQRNATLGTLFGSDAVRAASVLYSEGAAGVQEWEEAVNDAGFAAETAAMLQNNLAGDLEKLGGSLDTVFLKSGSGANEVLRSLVQSTEEFVDMIGQIPAPVLSAATGIAGVTGGALLLGGAFLTLAPRAFETVGHFKNLAAQSPTTARRLGNVGKTAGLAAVALIGLQVASQLAGTGMDDLGTSEEFEQAIRDIEKNAGAGAGALDKLATASGSGLTQVDGLGHALETVDLGKFAKGLDWVGSMGGVFDSEVGLAEEALKNFDGALSNLAQGGSLKQAAVGFQQAAAEGKAVGKSVQEVSESFPEYLNALRDLANTSNVALTDQELLNWAMGETPPAMRDAAESSLETAKAIDLVGAGAKETAASLEDVIEALFILGVNAMSSRDATAAFEGSVDEANAMIAELAAGTIALGDVLNDNATDFDLSTEAGRNANTTFQDLAQNGMNAVEAKAREGMGQAELQASLKGTYDSLITTANGLGITGGQAEALARKVLGVPDNISIEAWMSDAARRVAESTGAELDKLDGRQVHSYVTIHEHTDRTARNLDTGTSDKGYSGNGGVGGLAAGGAIFGPGTGTSDTAGLYALSNGEHVFTAAEVRKMGGQRAVYDFRSRLGEGVTGYAQGGSVGYNSVTHNQPVIREYSAPSAPASITADELLPAMRKAFDGLGHKRVDVSYTGPSIDALTTSIARRISG